MVFWDFFPWALLGVSLVYGGCIGMIYLLDWITRGEDSLYE